MREDLGAYSARAAPPAAPLALLLQHGNAKTLSPFVHRLQLTRWSVSALRVEAQLITFISLELTHYQYLTAYAYILGNAMAGLAYCGKDTSMIGLPTRLSTASVDRVKRFRLKRLSWLEDVGIGNHGLRHTIRGHVNDAVKLSGIGLTGPYRLMKTGTIKAKKSGRRTLVLMDSVRDYVQALPDMDLKGPA